MPGTQSSSSFPPCGQVVAFRFELLKDSPEKSSIYVFASVEFVPLDKFPEVKQIKKKCITQFFFLSFLPLTFDISFSFTDACSSNSGLEFHWSHQSNKATSTREGPDSVLRGIQTRVRVSCECVFYSADLMYKVGLICGD